MTLDSRNLRRYQPQAVPVAERPVIDGLRPPLDPDTILVGVGNSGEAMTLRCQAVAYSDGLYWSAMGLNNDRLAPRPLAVRHRDGSVSELTLTDRVVLGGEHLREQIQDEPLLRQRYTRLLRGIPVFETYPRAGAGGHGYPMIAALDIDLHISELLCMLRRVLRPTTSDPIVGQSDVQRLITRNHQDRAMPREKRIIIIGGACGAMGNAGHQVLPYLCRHLLAEQRITNYQIIGVLLGPRAFTGLTPFVRANYRALMESIEHLSRVGQRRAYINDLVINSQQPPYDRVILLDDPTLPGSGERATEAELDRFLDRAALSLALLLRRNVWETWTSHTANADGVPQTDGRLRYLHTVQSALIGMDRTRVIDLVEAQLAQTVADQFLTRFGTPASAIA
jgi:hypothetical protein